MSTGVDPALNPNAEEPALSVGGITMVGTAALGVVAALVPIPVATKAAVLGLIAALAPIVTALLVRRRVYSPATVTRMLNGDGRR
ncbi:hypothetical protein Rhe02_55760 [Rhizocola hellebori]|uniref:Uncharacterized protein n=1 Tax=Rhizocola hellebori TaxID=1392758 RepID=A0A8J3VHL0_9ACTN|nr:hypothetical protein [Rhizocola hellebori]GIH07509.1 hypothetical protein Rhe02_55760 [Rhizocola hellebori]